MEAYEEAVQRQAALTEQARMKEQAARELDSKAKSIKDKSITDEPKNKPMASVKIKIRLYTAI